MSLALLKQKSKIEHKQFVHKPFSALPYAIERCHDEKGRFYKVANDETRYDSITTVLSCRPASELLEWREAVGEERASLIGAQAASKGTKLHDLCEKYVSNINVDEYLKDPITKNQFSKFKKILDRIDNVYAVEKMLYHKLLRISGTVDCIAEFDGVLSIIDYKTSKKIKYESEIKHYFAQAAAYALMVKYMYNIKIEDIAILISVDDSDPIVYKAKVYDHFAYLSETLKMYRGKK